MDAFSSCIDQHFQEMRVSSIAEEPPDTIPEEPPEQRDYSASDAKSFPPEPKDIEEEIYQTPEVFEDQDNQAIEVCIAD